MSLREQLDADLKTALREKDPVRLSTVRMIKSAMKYRETAPGASGPLDEAGILQVIGSELKKRRDSVAEYEKAGRMDLADKERAEIAVLEGYLPAQLSAEELAKLVDDAIAEVQASGPRDMGKVMKILTPRIQGRADGRAVADLVKQKLA
ncbi:MAG TPA: GatB/YqeY domain-containing protein [Vulgatibacter sp.]|nr:GatB/YqeY domain-containing protein [Vulgatibacter sp.]